MEDNKDSDNKGSRGNDNRIDLWKFLLTIGVIAGVATAIGIVIFNPAILNRMREPHDARTVILLIIIVSTIGLAFLMIIQALFSTSRDRDVDQRFRRGREIFAGLMGVLGTIVGFYFGAAKDENKGIDISSVNRSGDTLYAFVVGGDPPYSFEFFFKNEKGDQDSSGETSIDGIVKAAVPASSESELRVTDSKGLSSFRKFDATDDTTKSKHNIRE